MAQYNPSEVFTPDTLRRLGNLGKSIYNYYGNHWGPSMGDSLGGIRNMYNNPEDLNRVLSIVRDMQGEEWRNNFIYNNRLPTKSAPYYTDPRVLYQGDGWSIQGPKKIYFDGSYVPDLAMWYKMVGSKDSFGRPSHQNYVGRPKY